MRISVLLMLLMAGCAGTFKAGSPAHCTQLCQSWGMELTGMVGVSSAGQRGPTACVCEKPRPQAAPRVTLPPSAPVPVAPPAPAASAEPAPTSMKSSSAAAVLALGVQYQRIAEREKQQRHQGYR
jgi:hypothetical protein